MPSVSDDQVLSFLQTLWALDHALQERSKAMASHLGVTSPQRLALRIIHTQPGISSGEVAEKLFLDPSTLTGVLQRLQGNGLLTRKKDKEDNRRSLLFLTAAGETIVGKKELTVEGVVREALADESPGSVRKTMNVLSHLTARLKATAPDEAGEAPAKRSKR